MAKAFMGVRLQALREQRGMTQAALAAALELSPSYVNQLESNQRPLSVPVLLRLQNRLGVDPRHFSQDAESLILAQLREVTANVATPSEVPLAELKSVAQQLPGIADVLIRLQRRCRSAEERVGSLAAGHDGDRLGRERGAVVQPHEEVRESFYAQHGDMTVLDEEAERFHDRLVAEAPPDLETSATRRSSASDRLASLLERYLEREHGVRIVDLPDDPATQVVRRYEPATRTLAVSSASRAGQRAFQLAIQAGLLAAGSMIDDFVRARAFATEEARSLARIGFANHYAGALLLPHRRFLADAEALRYDIELLSERYDVSFETVCHRLSTMQRDAARTIPFFFVRVDRAGNISKRQSATDFHFARGGGTCPLWNVYEAFARPDKVLTQLSRMPDGGTYLWIARTVTHRRGGHGASQRTFAVALGCDVRHAARLVYSAGIDLNDPAAATPIGAGCKICDRRDCAQRAFPSLGGALRIDENVRRFAPYADASRAEVEPGPG